MQAPSSNSLEREMAWSRKLAQMDHDSLIESARAEGYAIGYAEGYAEGYAIGYAEGYAIGYAEGYAIGYAEGIAIGQSKGENRLGQLMTQLFSLGRLQDVQEVASDMTYREKLFLEFGL